MRVEEQHPGQVGPVLLVERRVERDVAGDEGVTQAVPGQYLRGPPHQHRRHVSHRVDEGAGPGPDGHRRRRPPPLRRCGPRQVAQVGALVGVQAERPSQRLDHRVGRVDALALLQPGVVGDADPRQHGQLLAPQPGHAPGAVRRQTDVVGCQSCAPGPQELAEVPSTSCLRSGHATSVAHRAGTACPCQCQATGDYSSQVSGWRSPRDEPSCCPFCRPTKEHTSASRNHHTDGARTPHPVGPAHGQLHARRRLLHPQRRPARCRRGRRLLAREPPVDRDLVRALRRRLHAALRQGRGPVRPPPAVPDRDRPARRLLAGRRARRHSLGPPRRPRGAGHRGRDRDACRAVAADDLLPRGSAPGAGARAERRADGGRLHDRRRARRRTHRPAELALGVLRQRRRRARRPGGRPGGAHREPAHRAPAAGPARCAERHHGAVGARLRPHRRRRALLDGAAGPGRARAGDLPARGVLGGRAPGRGAARLLSTCCVGVRWAGGTSRG